MPRCSAYHAASSSGRRARKNTPPIPTTLSPTDTLTRTTDELAEDFAVRPELVEPRVLPLGGVRGRNREARSGAQLVGNRCDPFDQLLDARPRRHHLAALEIDQLAGESVPDRAPGVLLD